MSEKVKVRMKTASAGPEGNVLAGQITEVSPEEAEQLVEGRFAEYVLEKTNDSASDSSAAAGEVPESIITAEEFVQLDATAQKDLLAELEIEGDAGNAEKRAALYGEYLAAKAAAEENAGE